MFEAEYIQLVIKPKVDLILEDGVESIADLTAKFNAAFDCKVSKAKATGWLKALGYRVTRTVQIMRPRASAPAPAPERARAVIPGSVEERDERSARICPSTHCRGRRFQLLPNR